MITPSLYARILGASFDSLPILLRGIHDGRLRKRYSGRCSVARGETWIARAIGRIAQLPGSNPDLPIEVTIDCSVAGEIWTRRFGEHVMRSVICVRDRVLEERLGPVTLTFELDAHGESISWRFKRARLLFLPLPISWFSGCTATESIVDGRYSFDVRAEITGVGFLVHYQGWLLDSER